MFQNFSSELQNGQRVFKQAAGLRDVQRTEGDQDFLPRSVHCRANLKQIPQERADGQRFVLPQKGKGAVEKVQPFKGGKKTDFKVFVRPHIVYFYDFFLFHCSPPLNRRHNAVAERHAVGLCALPVVHIGGIAAVCRRNRSL